jgi:chitodextrinase
VEYRPAGAASWSSSYITGLAFDVRTSSWSGLFTPPVEAPAGAYEFRARLKDRDGDWGGWLPGSTLDVKNNLPAAKIAPRVAVVNEKQATVFDATPSSDLEGPLEYAWDFGDGATGTGDIVSHAYTKGGPMAVTMTVTDSDGAVANATVQLRVNLFPAAAFLSKQASGVHDFRVRFNGTPSSDAEGAVSYRWDFNTAADTSGDGISDNDVDSSEPMPTFDYKKAGTYAVKLTVTDSDGANATTMLTVKVRQVDADTAWITYLGALVVVAVVAIAVSAAALRLRGRKGPPEALPPGDGPAS